MDPLLAQYALQPETLLALDAQERAAHRMQVAARRRRPIRWSFPRLALRRTPAVPAPCC